MVILCVFGQHNYGKHSRGEGYEYSNFVPTLRRLGHEVIFFESWDRSKYGSFRELNEALLRVVEQVRPDVVLSVLMHYEIWAETWSILRDAGVAATVNWATDDSWKYSQFSRFLAHTFHGFATTYSDVYARYRANGNDNVVLTQWAANPEVLQPPRPARECQYPVSFIGTAHGRRRAWVTKLHQRGIEVACFGHGWPRGPLSAEDIPRVIRNSIISLNFSNGARTWDGIWPRQGNQIKARTFEVPGAGGFLLTEWADGLSEFFIGGREIAVFNDLPELDRLVRYYLANPTERDAIAFAGYERTRREHTYELRLSALLDFTVAQREKFFSRKGGPPPARIDWQKFEAAARRHVLDRRLRVLRRILVFPCTAIWGPARGPRAARRLVFEASWRLAGVHTYSAAGLPGRMFYTES